MAQTMGPHVVANPKVTVLAFCPGLPGAVLTGDEQTGENDHGLAGCRRGLRVLDIQRKVPDRGKNHKVDKHPSAACHERFAPPKVLDHVEAKERGAEVDGAQDHLRDKCVFNPGAVKHNSSWCRISKCASQSDSKSSR